MGEAFELARRWRRDKLEAARAARANTARPSVVSWLPAPGAKGLQAPRPAAPSALVAVREASAATRLGEPAPQSALQALARARLAHPLRERVQASAAALCEFEGLLGEDVDPKSEASPLSREAARGAADHVLTLLDAGVDPRRGA